MPHSRQKTRVLVGSAALAVRRPDLLQRTPRDVDLIVPADRAPTNALSGKHGPKVVFPGPVEVECALPGSTGREFCELVRADPDTIVSSGVAIPSIDALFALKTSHRFLKNSPHFWKTLEDWHVMRAGGGRVRPEFKSWLRRRAKETYDYAHPTLQGVSKKRFFDDSVRYIYDHDAIHRAVATGDVPAYTLYLKDGAPVECDREKWAALPHETKCAGVVEEAAVLAIERSLVPFPGAKSPRAAWLFAFSKVATSITSGWFRRWAYENAMDVIDRYPDGFWRRFQDAVRAGDVPAHDG